MRIYTNGFEAVVVLHHNGFIHDFQLFGNDLFWVQEKIFIREREFTIVEYYEIMEPINSLNEMMIFGISSSLYQVKGILVNHYKRYTDLIPSVIIRKLNELSISVDKNGKENYICAKK